MRIQPTVWMFTAPLVACTAKASTAPMAIRKMLTPIPIPASSWLGSSLQRPTRTRGYAIPPQPRRRFRYSRARAPWPDRPARPLGDPLRGHRLRDRARDPLAAYGGVARGGPHPLRLLVHHRHLDRRLRRRGGGAHLRAPALPRRARRRGGRRPDPRPHRARDRLDGDPG